MSTPLLAADFQQLADKFGLHTDAFIAHFIAFALVVAVIVFFGIKPVMRQLEERRRRIEEGEAMHARSQKELAEAKSVGERMLEDARNAGQKEIEHARQTAAKLQEDLNGKAAAEARAIVENARKQAILDTQKEKDALRGEFARLIAQATAQVTGKTLTEEDHRAINAEAIRNL